MASLRKFPRSPFWTLIYRDLDSGTWRTKSTGLRIDSPSDTRKAQRLAEKISVDESRSVAAFGKPAFVAWVPEYLRSHWGDRTSSTRRYQTAWQAIKMFLASERLVYPRQIRYAYGEAYLNWRKSAPVHGRWVGHNTALLELKFLSQLVNEAIRREFCESNPIARLGVARLAPKPKPELTDEQIAVIRAGLVKQPEWMRICFEIGLYTGCRFSECEIPLENIDIAAGTIRLRDAKRSENDPRKYFTVPIHEALKPLIINLVVSKNEFTCRLNRDKNGRINSFFRKCGVNITFHSLRVTFITRCHRGGLSESEAMVLVNHSSSLIHRIYSRLNVNDARAAQARIPLPTFG